MNLLQLTTNKNSFKIWVKIRIRCRNFNYYHAGVKPMPELTYCTAIDLARFIREKKASVIEILNAHLAQIAKYNPELNAVVTLNEEDARQRAREADAASAKETVEGHCTAYRSQSNMSSKQPDYGRPAVSSLSKTTFPSRMLQL